MYPTLLGYNIGMNIFRLDQNAVLCAQYHHDRHVVKMILETAQLLSGVWHTYQPGRLDIYKSTHLNHPCAYWARESSSNYAWLHFFGLSLCKEYTHRYGKRHKTEDILDLLIRPSIEHFPTIQFTAQPQCMPDEYKRESPIDAYRAYYIGEKVKGNKWTKREIPKWIAE